MKKIISSVLVFALMGIPVVSGVFADGRNDPLPIWKQDREQTKAELEELEENPNRDTSEYLRLKTQLTYIETLINKAEAAQLNEVKYEYESEPEVKKDEKKKNKSEKNIKENEANIDDYDGENEKSEEFSEETTESKKGMSTTKKVLIATGVVAALAGAGYTAYTYCPAVQSFINDQTIPCLQGCWDSFKNFISPVCDSFGSTPDKKLTECQRELSKCNSSKTTFSDKMTKFMLGEIVFFLGSLSNNFLIRKGATLLSQALLVKLAFF